MPKKRRSQTAQPPRSHREEKPADAKINAVNSWEDVADEEDHFHISREKVSLNDVGLGARNELEEDSEEEVMGLEKYGYSSGDEDEEEDEDEEMDDGRPTNASDADSDDEEQEEEVAEGWGTSKKAYYGGDEEEEYDPAEEEAEARRLQSEHLSKLSTADFLPDVDSDDDWPKPAKPSAITAVSKRIESLPTVLPEDSAARLKLLHTRHPEFAPLSAEFLSLQEAFPALEMARAAGHSEAVEKKWRVASTYLGVLSMYFAVLTTTDSEEVKSHPVMEALLKLRQAWEEVKDERVERIEPRISVPLENQARKRKLLETITSPSSSISNSDTAPTPKKPKTRLITTTQDFSDLDVLLTVHPSKPTSKPTASTPVNDFTESTALTRADAAEKSTRKRNLRFYTSQIVSRSAKRTSAGAAAGGDLDVPHKERRKERELRLQAEAQRRRNEGADLDSRSPSPAPGGAPLADQDDEYYQLLADTAAKRKEQKKAVYAAQKAGDTVRVEDGKAADGKRAIGYTIEKNKGLTPHRKKDVRNPRVKKRNAYEKKKKKISSVKAVYSGGQKGAYGGEMTGIKKNLVKSVKFK